jgi:hypothetical protein
MRIIRASALAVLLVLICAGGAHAQSVSPPFSGGGGGSGGFVYIGVLSGIPATCTVGQTAFITNATAGDNVYLCTATNTWTQQTGSSGTPPYVGTFTGTTATVNASTHGQGIHPHVDVYSSGGFETAANINCLTAGSATVSCADSTSTGNVVITLGGSYTVEYVIYGGAGVGPAGAQGAGCGTLGGDLTGTCASATVVDVNGAVVPASAAGTKTNSSRQLLAQTAADVVSEFSGGHTSAAYGLATDGSQQLFGSSSGLTVGTTTISGGTNGNVEINNSGVLGELGTTGTGNVVRATSPTLVTPALGTPASGNASNLSNIPIILTTAGSSGASTYTQSTNTLNIPNYAGGGGSVFTGSTATTPAFSATPTFSLADVSVKSPVRVEPGAMTANVTSVTFTNATAGAKFSIVWLEDGTGGRTLSYGGSATGTCEALMSTAANASTEQFYEVTSGGGIVGVGCVGSQSALRAIRVQLSINPVTFSATPTFDFSLGEIQTITLTGNVTSSTISNSLSGQKATFNICQDSTGSRSFVWPTGFKGTMTIGSTASKCNVQEFYYDGTNWWALSTGATNQ